MALVVKDRVRETSTTSGTGSLTLAGAVTGFQSFSAIGDGNTTYYTIVDAGTGAWEVGIGTYTSSTTSLSRDTVLESSTGGSLINFGSNLKDVFVTYPAERSVYADETNATVTVPALITGGNVNFTGTGNRITGDFVNANQSLRTLFQGSTVNNSTNVGAIPNGTGTAAFFTTFASSDPTNASVMQMGVNSAGGTAALNATITGTGTYLPMTFLTGGSEAMRITNAGSTANFGFGTNNPATKMHIVTKTAASTDSVLITSPSNYAVYIRPQSSSGANNALVNTNDAQIGFDAGTINNGALVIAPWSNVAGGAGMRMLATGATTFKADTAYMQFAPDLYSSLVVGPRPANDSISSLLMTTNSGGTDYWKFDAGTASFGLYNNANIRMIFDSAGNAVIGATNPVAGQTFTVNKSMTGGTTAMAVRVTNTVASGVTSEGRSFDSSPSTAASAFTIGSYSHYFANGLTKGAGSTITSQIGFYVSNAHTQANTNISFQGSVDSASNRWNLYMNGTAQNWMKGKVAIGTDSTSTAYLSVTPVETSAAPWPARFYANNGGFGTTGLEQYSLVIGGNYSGGAAEVNIIYGAGGRGLQFGSWNGSSYADRILFGPTGSVGIGTTSPSYKLHVVGDTFTSGQYYGQGAFICTFTSSINANTNRVPGVWGSYASSATNTPTNSGILWNGMSGTSGDGTADGGQFWQDYNSDNFYTRRRWGGSFTAWALIGP